jgi:hypothetical protein
MISAEFSAIPAHRLAPGMTTIEAMKFAGTLAQAKTLFGKPARCALALSTDDNDPEWRVVYHATWDSGAEIFGAFDPSAFVFLWNENITEIEQTSLTLEIDDDVAAGLREAVYLSPSLQPCRLRISADGRFETAPLFLLTQSPEENALHTKSQKPPSRGFFNVAIDSSDQTHQ